MRKWVIALVVAAIAAVLAAAGILKGDTADFAWGLAAGLGIGAIFAWLAERD